MRSDQRDRPDAIDHALDADKAALVHPQRKQKGDQRRPPDPCQPAKDARHHARGDLGPAGVAGGETQGETGQLGDPEQHDRHAEDHQIGRLGQGGHQLPGQHDAQHHKADQPPVPAHHAPRRCRPVAEGLGDVGHQRRQDQPGQRDFGRQERPQPGNQDHRHGKADRALDETGEQGDRGGRQHQPGIKARKSGHAAAPRMAATGSFTMPLCRVGLLRCICKACRRRGTRKDQEPTHAP